jgi:hypothetical protein
MEGHDLAEDRLAPVPASTILRDDSRSDLYLLPDAENTAKNGTASYTTFEVVDLGTGFINVEGTDDD